ncbi:MAG: hypothetical protein ABL917_03705 [Parcubacteria group bacterium]
MEFEIPVGLKGGRLLTNRMRIFTVVFGFLGFVIMTIAGLGDNTHNYGPETVAPVAHQLHSVAITMAIVVIVGLVRYAIVLCWVSEANSSFSGSGR